MNTLDFTICYGTCGRKIVFFNRLFFTKCGKRIRWKAPSRRSPGGHHALENCKFYKTRFLLQQFLIIKRPRVLWILRPQSRPSWRRSNSTGPCRKHKKFVSRPSAGRSLHSSVASRLHCHRLKDCTGLEKPNTFKLCYLKLAFRMTNGLQVQTRWTPQTQLQDIATAAGAVQVVNVSRCCEH